MWARCREEMGRRFSKLGIHSTDVHKGWRLRGRHGTRLGKGKEPSDLSFPPSQNPLCPHPLTACQVTPPDLTMRMARAEFEEIMFTTVEQLLQKTG